jgi:hypothetical protein
MTTEAGTGGRATSGRAEWNALFIGGRWVPSVSDQMVDVVPHNSRPVGRAPLATVADVDGAVASARQAFDVGGREHGCEGLEEYFELKSIAT